MTEQLVRVEAPHFVAGLIIKDDHCIRAAPILSWAVGKPAAHLSSYFRSKKWRAMKLSSNFHS